MRAYPFWVRFFSLFYFQLQFLTSLFIQKCAWNRGNVKHVTNNLKGLPTKRWAQNPSKGYIYIHIYFIFILYLLFFLALSLSLFIVLSLSLSLSVSLCLLLFPSLSLSLSISSLFLSLCSLFSSLFLSLSEYLAGANTGFSNDVDPLQTHHEQIKHIPAPLCASEEITVEGSQSEQQLQCEDHAKNPFKHSEDLSSAVHHGLALFTNLQPVQLVWKVLQYTSNIPPLRNAVPRWLLSFGEREMPQYTSNLYCGTYPICTSMLVLNLGGISALQYCTGNFEAPTPLPPIALPNGCAFVTYNWSLFAYGSSILLTMGET